MSERFNGVFKCSRLYTEQDPIVINIVYTQCSEIIDSVKISYQLMRKIFAFPKDTHLFSQIQNLRAKANCSEKALVLLALIMSKKFKFSNIVQTTYKYK